MKAATHLAGVIYATHTNLFLDLIEGEQYYKAIKTIVMGHGPLWVVCKGALFVMPWHQVKTEFERTTNWYKLEQPYIKSPRFIIKVNPKPLGNAELLTGLYVGVEDLGQTQPTK